MKSVKKEMKFYKKLPFVSEFLELYLDIAPQFAIQRPMIEEIKNRESNITRRTF